MHQGRANVGGIRGRYRGKRMPVRRGAIDGCAGRRAYRFTGRILFERCKDQTARVGCVNNNSFKCICGTRLPIVPCVLAMGTYHITNVRRGRDTTLGGLTRDSLIRVPGICFAFSTASRVPVSFVVRRFIGKASYFASFSGLFLDGGEGTGFTSRVTSYLTG